MSGNYSNYDYPQGSYDYPDQSAAYAPTPELPQSTAAASGGLYSGASASNAHYNASSYATTGPLPPPVQSSYRSLPPGMYGGPSSRYGGGPSYGYGAGPSSRPQIPTTAGQDWNSYSAPPSTSGTASTSQPAPGWWDQSTPAVGPPGTAATIETGSQWTPINWQDVKPRPPPVSSAPASSAPAVPELPMPQGPAYEVPQNMHYTIKAGDQIDMDGIEVICIAHAKKLLRAGRLTRRRGSTVMKDMKKEVAKRLRMFGVAYERSADSVYSFAMDKRQYGRRLSSAGENVFDMHNRMYPNGATPEDPGMLAVMERMLPGPPNWPRVWAEGPVPEEEEGGETPSGYKSALTGLF